MNSRLQNTYHPITKTCTRIHQYTASSPARQRKAGKETTCILYTHTFTTTSAIPRKYPIISFPFYLQISHTYAAPTARITPLINAASSVAELTISSWHPPTAHTLSLSLVFAHSWRFKFRVGRQIARVNFTAAPRRADSFLSRVDRARANWSRRGCATRIQE